MNRVVMVSPVPMWWTLALGCVFSVAGIAGFGAAGGSMLAAALVAVAGVYVITGVVYGLVVVSGVAE